MLVCEYVCENVHAYIWVDIGLCECVYFCVSGFVYVTCVCVCVSMGVYMCVCLCERVYAYVRVRVLRMPVSMWVCVSIWKSMCTCVSVTCLCKYVCVYMSMCACMYNCRQNSEEDIGSIIFQHVIYVLFYMPRDSLHLFWLFQYIIIADLLPCW